MLQKLTIKILATIINSNFTLMLINLLLPVAIYFETGIITAITSYFAFFLLFTVAKHSAREAHNNENKIPAGSMGEAIKEAMKFGDTTVFENDKIKGKITKINLKDMPEGLKEILKKEGLLDENDTNETNETNETITKH